MPCRFYFAACHLQGAKEVQIIMSIVICNIFNDATCNSCLYDFEWLDNSAEWTGKHAEVSSHSLVQGTT
jgi:hypothetical protein